MKSLLHITSCRALAVIVVILFAITDIGWAAEEKVDADVPFFFEMERFMIPVIRGRRVEKYVIVKVTLELADAESKSLVEQYSPPFKRCILSGSSRLFWISAPWYEGH